MSYDWNNFDSDLMKDFNWFLYKINQRSCIELGYIDEDYESVNRHGYHDFGLGKDVEYFHPTITLDDRMRYIATHISQADMDIDNILCNTYISHFYGARGIHQSLTDSKDPSDCFIDFHKILNQDTSYTDKIRHNIFLAKKQKKPLWGSTEIHTSLQTASRNYVRSLRNQPDKKFDTFDLLEWVSSFIINGTNKSLIESSHIKDTYDTLIKLDGVGDYFAFHGAASTSVLPQMKYHVDQRFVAPGPGARFLIKKMWPDAPSKEYADSIYFLREKGDEIGLTDNVDFHPKAYNVWDEDDNPVFDYSHDSLKYYGTEVLSCQFGIYLQIRNDRKACMKRKVSRSDDFVGLSNNSNLMKFFT